MRHLVEEALAWGRSQGGSATGPWRPICDRLAVAFGAELAGIVPGRVSTEVDADLSFDTRGDRREGPRASSRPTRSAASGASAS